MPGAEVDDLEEYPMMSVDAEGDRFYDPFEEDHTPVSPPAELESTDNLP